MSRLNGRTFTTLCSWSICVFVFFSSYSLAQSVRNSTFMLSMQSTVVNVVYCTQPMIERSQNTCDEHLIAWNNIVAPGKSHFLWSHFVWTEENWNFVSPLRLPCVMAATETAKVTAGAATVACGMKTKMRFWSRRQQINSHFNTYTSFHRVIRFCWRSILCVWVSISSDIWNCESNLTAFFSCSGPPLAV